MNNNLFIYIHIPFCERKCSYCNFPRSTGQNNLHELYFNALEKEINETKLTGLNKSIPIVNTIYFGGGTPSSVNAKYISRILSLIQNKYRVKKHTEITVECNPNSLTHRFTDKIMDAGVNRFSLGVQSINDDELQKLGRIHNAQRADTAFKILRDAGAKNISVDLIYGIPGQTKESWHNTLKHVIINFQPEHISAYSLSVEKGTPFFRWKKNNVKKWHWPDDDTVIDWYWLAVDFMKNYGYHCYEISNFSKRGFESLHNQSYWDTTKNYIGFGAAAHSYCTLSSVERKARFRNIKSVSEYIERVNSGGRFRFFSRNLSLKKQIGEQIYLGLRVANGIIIEEIHNKFFGDIIQRQIDCGLIKKLPQNRIALTKRGLQIANTVMAEFV